MDADIVTRRSMLLKELLYYAHVEQLPTVLAEYGVSNVGIKNTACHVVSYMTLKKYSLSCDS